MNQQVLKEASFDEIFDAQENFRILMEAMSRPGKILRLKKHGFSKAPEGFDPNLLTVLKTLGDHNVSFSTGNMKNGPIQRYLEMNTGMISSVINKADYVLFDGKEYDESILSLNTGSPEFPEDSATAVFSVESIQNNETPQKLAGATGLSMAGPGIKDVRSLEMTGMNPIFLRNILEMNSVFPLGIDSIFVDTDGNIACMPRTTKAEVK